jgi:hypothetical protein
MTYAVEDILNPRSFIYSSNGEALVLQSVTNETRLSFLNNTANQYSVNPRIILSASNENFLIIKDSNVITDFSVVNGESRLTVPGRIQTNLLEIPTTATNRKAVILRDYNTNSAHQFAGIGFTDGQNVYQTPSQANQHIFYAAMDGVSSLELMRLQTNSQGSPQVGIGTTPSSSNLRLRVGGDTLIDGSLTVQGELNFDKSEFLRLDPETNRIASNILPTKLLYLDDTNKVDPTYLSQSYQFQFLRGQKNVGIGTKVPLQRFHVQGTSYMSERLGIGVTHPVARLHLQESLAIIPTIVLENQVGGNILECYGSNGTPAFTVLGNRTGVGIGTSLIALSNALEIHGGNAIIYGNCTASNIISRGLTKMQRIHVADDTNVYMTQQDLTQTDSTIKRTTMVYTPMQCFGGLSTSDITTLGLSPFVHFKNCGVRVDGDMILGSQMYVLSDARIKTNPTPIPNPLQRLERMHGYTYTLPNGRVQAGLLAQEVIDVLPEAVTMLPASDYYAVSYDSIVPLLVEAVRDLSKQLRELKRNPMRR